MPKYFGKCFGSPKCFRAPEFWTQMPQLFIIKICCTVKVNSIFSAAWDTRNLCQKFSSQGPALRILGLGLQVPSFRDAVSGSQVSGYRVPQSWVSGSWFAALRVPGSWVLGCRVCGFRVSGPDFRPFLFLVNIVKVLCYLQIE